MDRSKGIQKNSSELLLNNWSYFIPPYLKGYITPSIVMSKCFQPASCDPPLSWNDNPTEVWHIIPPLDEWKAKRLATGSPLITNMQSTTPLNISSFQTEKIRSWRPVKKRKIASQMIRNWRSRKRQMYRSLSWRWKSNHSSTVWTTLRITITTKRTN